MIEETQIRKSYFSVPDTRFLKGERDHLWKFRGDYPRWVNSDRNTGNDSPRVFAVKAVSVDVGFWGM